MHCLASGDCPRRGDHSVRWTRAAEDEVRALPQEKDELQPQEGSHPLPRSIQDILENSQGVRTPSVLSQ